MSPRTHFSTTQFLVLLAVVIGAASATCGPLPAANITDFFEWTQVADPPHPGMTGLINDATTATLTATPIPPDVIPAGTDIGYQSVDGQDVASSTNGFYFSPAEDFQLAVDYDVTSTGSVGFAGIGFGIGEDRDGMDSAGMGLAINNGTATGFAGAARIGDATQSPLLFGAAATLSGRMFVGYDSATGDITVGINATPGAATATESQTFAGIQQNWNDAPLLASFFLRSDQVLIFNPLSAGTLDAVFSNFEVLSGTPLQVPEPASAALMLLVVSTAVTCRRRGFPAAGG